MKNLEVLGVHELDAGEMKNQYGGTPIAIIGVVIAAIQLAAYVVDNREKIVEGFKEGYNAALND